MSDMTMLRIGIAVAMSLLLGAIIYFGRGRKASQRRRDNRADRVVGGEPGARQEPSLGEQLAGSWGQPAGEGSQDGLTFGHMDVFHRLVDGRPEQGPVFSVANIIKPGSFDMASIGELETPAIAFFLTLPAPLSALDAWDTMLPAAQRMSELLDGVVLDEERNALGRQRIQHIRDELRSYDRQNQAAPLSKPTRW